MKTEWYIAQRMSTGGGFAAALSRISMLTVALGVAVMIVAVAVLQGFRHEITNKVAGFGSHITISPYHSVGRYEEAPLDLDSTLLLQLGALPNVHHVQPYATKGGMVKTSDQIEGILLRGMAPTYDTTFYSQCLTSGHLPNIQAQQPPSNEVLVSQTLASRLGLKVGDKLRTYFWQGRSYRARAFAICGIYRTDLAEVDNLYVLGDIRQVQRLNDWEPDQVGGIELTVDDFARLEATATEVASHIGYDMSLSTVVAQNPSLFAWLDLLDSNISLIMIIMSIVCAIAVTSSLLIMIFEKRQTIGLLKTLGATNRSVRRIFLLRGGRLVAWGIVVGTVVAVGLCLLQSHTSFIRLDPESYSMSTVPIALAPGAVVGIALATAVVCTLAMYLPSAYIGRLTPREILAE